MTPLERLLEVQEHDLACDRLRHRRRTLPGRADLERLTRTRAEVVAAMAGPVEERDRVRREVARLEGDVDAITRRLREVEATMYSGTVTSPRELQAMQADVEQLDRQRRNLEDRELGLMERQEQLDAELAGLEARLAALDTELTRVQGTLAEAEAEIDAALTRERQAREAAASGLPDDLLTTYEQCRSRSSSGVGIARLVGSRCQGCHLTIPATEVARIRTAGADGPVAHCDNCGAILVPG